ncbi:MAG: Alkaline shock protein [Brockia lithotrophica]|uniref:Alkaline shock protein n=1 Tax=Brockia lithotrophica TaxID=933949 RepID=A0A2T5G683_9BACL|nr:Asp23/Gls24 family envelope stress response protein [Brockia lithotrophica]PTQ51684.1 MAG: Alkaline shock protein [Brockia lithotrophica]
MAHLEGTYPHEETPLGKIVIAPEVVATIAGIAAREVEGVTDLSGGFVGDITERFGRRRNLTKGVQVEVGQEEAAVDLSLVVEYGYALPQVAGQVQEAVRRAIETMTGLRVVEVNVHIVDLRFPSPALPQEDEESEPPRVR